MFPEFVIKLIIEEKPQNLTLQKRKHLPQSQLAA
jgi:hypothetical protein